MSSTVQFIGIDVGCTSLSAAVAGCKPRDFAHTPRGVEQLAAWARRHSGPVLRAVCESSGPYSRRLAALLQQQGLPTAIVPPQRVRANAQALGRRSKTDRIDAQVILDYAMHAQPEPWVAPPPAQARLAALWNAWSDLRAEERRWANRLHALQQLPDSPAEVLALPQTLCSAFAAERLKLEQAMQALFDAEPELAQRRALLLSIPGIGPQTATVLLARADILLTRSDKQLTAYAGLAPLHRLSGSSLRGRSRIGRGGDAQLRTLLYLAALSASRHEPGLKDFYQRLRTSGKHGKAALIAVARKLLLIAQAVLKAGKPFEPRPPQP